PTSPTPASARPPARSASTTASSCRTGWSCAAAPASRRARTCARPTATSSRRPRAGSSAASASRATPEPRTMLATLLLLGALALPGERKTENVVLVTYDGLRWQEVFSGADEVLLTKENGGVRDVQAERKAFWRDTPEARREALLPFLWGTVA